MSCLALRPLVLCLILVPTVAEQGTVGSLDSVSCSLRSYEDLFRQAHRQELERDLTQQHEKMRSSITRQEEELQTKMDALNNHAAMSRQRRGVFPTNWQLVGHVVNGSCHVGAKPEESSLAAFDFSMEFRIFDDQWTSIPIIDSQTIVSDWGVLHTSQAQRGDESSWQFVPLGFDTLLVLKRRQDVQGDEAWEDHTLVTNTSGLYRVSFRAHVHVRSNRQLHGLQLNLVYPLTEAGIRLFHDTRSVHIHELSIEPSAFLQTFESDDYTDMTIQLPSTRRVSVKWRMLAAAEAGKSGSEALPDTATNREAKNQNVEGTQAQATVVHDSLHSIDDNILQSLHSFKYLLDSEQSLSSVEIHFLGNARVTSVVAHGMMTWRAMPMSNNNSVRNTTSKAEPVLIQDHGTIVQVTFKSSVITKEVVLMISTEVEFDVGHKAVSIPRAVCQNVLRQSGTLAIQKVANVEVYEQSAQGVARSGLEGVPSHMRGRTSRPIVLAYKFVMPLHAVTLSVIHHEDLPTLDAVVDVALYRALVTGAQVMHSLSLVLQNTHRQYLEVQGIPQAATLWSVKVNSLSTKPARGSKASLLVPLMVGSGGEDGAVAAKSSVELAWLTSADPLREHGTMVLDPPSIDLPLSVLLAEVHFPDAFEVNFTGSVKQVQRFSQPQPSPVSYETGEDVVPKDFDFAAMGGASIKGGHKGSAGVKAKMPKYGHRYLFEQLLVVNGSAHLNLTFGPLPVNKSDGQGSWAETLAAMLPAWLR